MTVEIYPYSDSESSLDPKKTITLKKTVLEDLTSRIASLEKAAGLDEDEAMIRAKQSGVTSKLRTAGWFGGVFLVTESAKFLTWLALKDHMDNGTVSYLQNNAPWVLGFTIGGDLGGRFGNNLGVKTALWWFSRNANSV